MAAVPLSRPAASASARRLALAGVLAAALAGACGGGADPLAPVTSADVAGTYRLTSLGGHALPWADTSATGSGNTWLGAELTLRADGVVVSRRRSRYKSQDAQPIEQVDSTARWTLNPAGADGPNVVRTTYDIPGDPGPPGGIHRPSVHYSVDYRAEAGGRRLRTLGNTGYLAAPGDVWVR